MSLTCCLLLRFCLRLRLRFLALALVLTDLCFFSCLVLHEQICCGAEGGPEASEGSDELCRTVSPPPNPDADPNPNPNPNLKPNPYPIPRLNLTPTLALKGSGIKALDDPIRDSRPLYFVSSVQLGWLESHVDFNPGLL
jgi:hypothetical protein